MQRQELTVKRREDTGKGAARRIRRSGAVPGVLYGGDSPRALVVDPKSVLRMIQGHGGTTQLLSLRFDGDGETGTRMAVLRELQFHPVTERLLHVDLQEVSANKPIHVRVGLHPVGEATGVKETKGILNLVLHELDVSCLPGDIPERIDVDVTRLRIGDVFTVADLAVPAGVRVLNDPEQAIVTIAAPMAEETPAAAATPAATAEPEVLSERKPKDEDDKGKK